MVSTNHIPPLTTSGSTRNGDEVLSSYTRREFSVSMSRKFANSPDFAQQSAFYPHAPRIALPSGVRSANEKPRLL